MAGAPGCPGCTELVAQVAAQEERIRKLEVALEESRRAGKRQAGPFSKGDPKPHPQRPGRKAGASHGPSTSRPVPARVGEVFEAPVPCRCPGCGGDVEEVEVAKQFQTEVPQVRPRVRQFNVHVGRCRACGRRVQGRHPLQTSDALGAAASQPGPNALALAAHLNKAGGMPYGKVVAFFFAAFEMKMCVGGLARALHRLTGRLEPTYQGFLLAIRESPVVYADETSMRVSGMRGWLWLFVSMRLTVYVQRMSRGSDVVEEVLGFDFPGILAHDGWSPYDKVVGALAHQQCLGHLDRRAKDLLEVATRGAVRFPRAVRALLGDGLDLRDRRDAGEISPHGLAVATGHLESRLTRLLSARITHEANCRFQKHLDKHCEEIFTFVRHEGVEATAWPADRATRPAVLFRKVSGGHRSNRGAHTHDVLLSVQRTCAQRGADPIGIFTKALHQPAPRVLEIEPSGAAPPSPSPATFGLRRKRAAGRARKPRRRDRPPAGQGR